MTVARNAMRLALLAGVVAQVWIAAVNASVSASCLLPNAQPPSAGALPAPVPGGSGARTWKRLASPSGHSCD